MQDLLRYSNYDIVFQEVPSEVALAINITQCPHHCDGCHSSVLAEDFGNYLRDDLDDILKEYGNYITCICLMGGDQHMGDLIDTLTLIKRTTDLKTAVYSGADDFSIFLPVLPLLDYLKVGPYIEARGGLSSPTTNQKFYIKGKDDIWRDETHIFWKDDKK